MQIHLIWAQARKRVIGKDGVMPWHLPEDLAHFKAKTAGCPVIMGRKTWDSLPPRFKPLPGRRNIVMSRFGQPHAMAKHFEQIGVETAQDAHKALCLCEQNAVVWIIGGAQVYAQMLPFAHRAEVTEIDADFAGDAFAPELGPAWVETARQAHMSSQGLRLSFVTLQNTSPLAWKDAAAPRAPI